jgi:hypothetical protein
MATKLEIFITKMWLLIFTYVHKLLLTYLMGPPFLGGKTAFISEPSCLDLAVVWGWASPSHHSPHSPRPFPTTSLPPRIHATTPKCGFSAKDWALASHLSMLGPSLLPYLLGDLVQGLRLLVGTWHEKNEMAQFSGHLNSHLAWGVDTLGAPRPGFPL